MQLQCATKGRDTVGQPPNAENDASHLLSLQAQKSRESNAVTAAVVCGNRMTNSIPPFTAQEVETMSQATSPSSGKPYGLARVCRVWSLARSTVYWQRHEPTRPDA